MLITSASCTRQCAQVNSGTFLILLLRRCLNFGGGHERNFARGNWPRRRGYRGLFVRRGQCSPPSNRAIGGRTSWAASSLMVETSRSWASAVCAKRCCAHGKPCADGEFTGTAKFVGRKKWRAGIEPQRWRESNYPSGAGCSRGTAGRGCGKAGPAAGSRWRA